MHGDFEKSLLALSGVIARNSDQTLVVRDGHEDYREALRKLVPLIQDLTMRIKQVKALAGQAGQPS